MRARVWIAAAWSVAIVACSATKTANPFFANTSPVTLTDHVPASGAVAVPLDVQVVAEMGGAIATNGLAQGFRLFETTTTGTAVAAHYSVGDGARVVTLVPDKALDPGATYIAKIDEGYPDAKGRPLLGFRWSFTTDTPPAPALTDLVPPPAKTNVPTNFLLRAAFNVPLDPATVSAMTVTIADSSGGTTFQPAHVSYDAPAKAILVTPDVDALPSAGITVTLGASGLRDAYGRVVPASLFSNWTFHTGTGGDFTRPLITGAFTAAEQPAGSGTAVVTLPNANDSGVWDKELRYEATFAHAAPPTPVGCPDVPDPQIQRVAFVGSAGSIALPGLENGNWTVTMVVEDGSGRRSDPQTLPFTVTAGTVTFDSAIRPILDDRCAFDGCHSGTNAPGFMDLKTSRTQIEQYHPVDPAKPIAVQPYCLSLSYLWWKVEPGYPIDGGLMPPDYVDTPALTRAERDAIRQWIEQGAN